MKSLRLVARSRRASVRTCSWIGVGVAVFCLAFEAQAADPRIGADFFETKIRPILAENCYSCHSNKEAKPKGGLKLDSITAIRNGGNLGAIIEPGKPDDSLLIQAVSYSGDAAKMPPKKKLSDEVIGDFRRWVQGGAPMPAESHGAIQANSDQPKPTNPTDWWSLKPIVRPVPPALTWAETRTARTPIDAFLLDRLKAKGLMMAPEADRRTLIRRLSIDLTGLPPTPEEVGRFLEDHDPQAYERLVDRLLDNPHFGERWARQWMDLVHFAETHGHDQDRIRPNAWPYRDYLIDSFNRDTPYARFVQEQIAADILFPNEPKLIVALGMIAAGPWDESSLRDIRDDSIDRQIGYYLDRDDMVSNVISTFDSTTIHCARCHDHKFDPIPQKDYYALQAVFAGVDKAERSYDLDPKVESLRKSLGTQLKGLKAGDPAVLATLLSTEVQASVARWEADSKAGRASWIPLEPSRASSGKKGSVLTVQPDRSVLASGVKAEQDIYTFQASPDIRRVTAIRLEVLPDDSLPANGPGRNDNGNLHLTEFEVWVEPIANPIASRRIKIVRAAADFDQAGWGIDAAIDDLTNTAWGIYPEVGKPHEAVFELAEPTTLKPGETFTIKLVQTNPPGHLIGRFRLSVTTSNRPAQYLPVKAEIKAIFDVAADQRTVDQKKALARHLQTLAVERQLADLPPRQLVYAAAFDFAPDASHVPPGGPRPVFVLKRGDIHQPTTPAEPGTMSCVAGLPSRFETGDPKDEGSRRAQLAQWISDSKNPLTWRSIANRLWQSHFGRGIVDTPNDFGRMGSTPTHPELLDWLASELLENSGSLKKLHRTIVLSAAYRQAIIHDPKSESIDADNRLLWRQNRRRLDAESVHDAILQISGQLDKTMRGPSVQQFSLSKGVHVTPVVDYLAYNWDSPGAGRRGVYRFLFRTLPDPFMDTLDGADASQLVAVRSESITPLQSLALLNNPFVLRYSEHFAERLDGLNLDLPGKIRTAYELAFNREADDAEISEWTDYASKYGLANFARILFNSNEFLFVN